MSIKGKGRYPLVIYYTKPEYLRKKICNCGRNNNLMIFLTNYVFGTDVLKIWNGSEWKISSAMKANTVLGFIKKTLKTWDGNNWINVNSK